MYKLKINNMESYKIIYYLITISYLIFALVRYKLGILFDKNTPILDLLSIRIGLPIIVLWFCFMATMDGFRLYYNSDSYLTDRKMEIIENYENGRSVDELSPSDTYFDEVTITEYSKSEYSGGVSEVYFDSVLYKISNTIDISYETHVIFWADREKLDDNFFNLKWRLLPDFDFDLDPNDELDKRILDYYFNERIERLP